VTHPFLQRLDAGVLLADGAMGTQLYARGIPFDQCFDELNLSNPSLVQDIHREYIRAGAEMIETNTFGANRFKLAADGAHATRGPGPGQGEVLRGRLSDRGGCRRAAGQSAPLRRERRVGSRHYG